MGYKEIIEEILENARKEAMDAANSSSTTSGKTTGPKGAPLNIVPNPNADPNAAKKMLQAERFDKIKDIQSVNDEIDNFFSSFYKNHKDDFDGKNIKLDDFKKGILERVSGYGLDIAGLKPINDILNDPKANEKDLLEVVKRVVHTKADEILKMPLLKIGDKIKVKGKAGGIEDGWEVGVIDYNNNKVQVVKVEKDKDGKDIKLSKYVKISELAEWNDAKNSNPQEAEKSLSPEDADPQEKILRDNIDAKRNGFAKTEYCEKEAMQRIRQFFDKFSKEKKYEENATVKSYREDYECSLKEYKDYQIEKLKDKNLSGKELEAEVKKIFSFFNLDETTKYYDARTKAKMDYLAEKEDKNGKEKSFGKKWLDKVRLGCAKAGDFYNKKIPTSAKIGLGVAAFATGAYSLIVLKRATGAFIMLAAGGSQLDKVGQFVDAIRNKREGNKAYEEIVEGDDHKVDFGKLSGILDEKINNIDEKLNNKNIRSGISNVSAAVIAGILGYTTVNAIADFVEHKEAFSNSGVSGFIRKLISEKVETTNLAGAEFPKRPSVGIFANADQMPSNNVNAAAASGNLSHLNNIGQDIAEGKNDVITPIPENVPGANADAVPVGGKGFWGAIHDKLDKLEPGGKHNGETAKIFNRAVGEYAKSHGMTVAEATEKLSHVDKGTNFSMTQDAKGIWQANLDDQNIKFLHGLEHHAPSHAGVPSPETLTADVSPEIPKASSVIDQRSNITAKIEANLGRIDALDHRQEDLLGGFDRGIENATTDPNELLKVQQDIEQLREEVRGDRLKLNSLMDVDNPKGIGTSAVETPLEDVKLAGASAAGAATAVMGSKKILDKNRKNENAIGLVKMLKENVSTTKFLRATLERITGGSSHQISFWKEIKDQPFDVKKLSKNNKKIKLNMEDVILEFKEILGNEALPKKKADGKIETVNEWLRRVTQKSFEKNKQSN